MKTCDLENKIVVLAPYNDNFSEVVLDNLVHHSSLNMSSIVILRFYGKHKVTVNKKKKSKYQEVDWGSLDVQDLPNLKSLFSFSLQPSSAKIICELEKKCKISFGCVYVFSTGDEVDRWTKLFNNKTDLVVDEKSLVDENVLKVINSQFSFIAPVSFRKNELMQFMSYNNLIDSHVPFTVLSDGLREKVNGIKYELGENCFDSLVPDNIRVLVGTKPCGYFKADFFINLFLLSINKRKKLPKNLTYGVWVPNGISGFFCVFFMLLTYAITFKKVKFEILRNSSRLQYYLMLGSYDLLIAQGRGGASSIREMLKLNKGVIFKEGSINHRSISSRLNVSWRTYCSYSDALASSFKYTIAHVQEDNIAESIYEVDKKASKFLGHLMWKSLS